MITLIFYSLVDILFVAADECGSGIYVMAKCAPDCLACMDSDICIEQDEDYNLEFLFYDKNEELCNSTKEIYISTDLNIGQDKISPIITRDYKLNYTITGKEIRKSKLEIYWGGEVFDFSICFVPPCPLYTTNPAVIYNCNKFTISLSYPSPYYFISPVALDSVTPEIENFRQIETLMKNSTNEIGPFYIKVAGIYKFCFEIKVCNILYCYNSWIDCYDITILPCSPHCLICDGVCDDGSCESAQTCNCIECDNPTYRPDHCHCSHYPCRNPIGCILSYEGVCRSCLPDYFPLYYKGVLHCITTDYCLEPILDDTDARCHACKPGLYLALNNICCSQNCQICGATGGCTVCESGYEYIEPYCCQNGDCNIRLGYQ